MDTNCPNCTNLEPGSIVRTKPNTQNCFVCGRPVKKQAFWDRQASEGSLSGTKDRYAKELEMAAIAQHVKDGMRVLDVGCGDGETLNFLASKYQINAVGIDYSENMILEARNMVVSGGKSFPGFFCREIKDVKKLGLNNLDLIYTQRALINLDTWEEQRTAILDILKLLKPGGLYVMVECFTEGLDEINDLRLRVGLESIVPPWHNRYLSEWEVDNFLFRDSKIEIERSVEHFSGAYYFMSRVVNAWEAKQMGNKVEYDNILNRLGTLLPPESVNLRGQSQCWIVRKK